MKAACLGQPISWSMAAVFTDQWISYFDKSQLTITTNTIIKDRK